MNNKLESTKKLCAIITIVKKEKADYFIDVLNDMGANMQLSFIANGTTKNVIFRDEIATKRVIFSILTEDMVKKTLQKLEDKFKSVRDGKGVAFAIPLSSVMGVSFFNFLSNNKSLI